VRGVDLGALDVALEHDGRRGEGEQEAEEEGLAGGAAERVSHGGDQRHRQRDLQPAPDEHQPPHLHDAAQRELQPDGEEQEHHADLGEEVDGLGLADESQPVGADDDARNHEADDGRQAQSAEQEGDGDRGEQQEQQILE
jgi:hypothetical protein